MPDDLEPTTEHTDRIADALAAEATVDEHQADDFPEYRDGACLHEYPSEWINLGAGDAIEVCGGCAVALPYLRIIPNT